MERNKSCLLPWIVSFYVSAVVLGGPSLLASAAAIKRERHEAEYCAMYDICGTRKDGQALNCPYGSPSVKPSELFSQKVQSLCPTITGNVCCTEAQFDILRTEIQQAIPLLVGCPACLRNFLNFFCELSCSPNQSLFINVTSIAKAKANLTVDTIDLFVDDSFGQGLYDSCKDVKFGAMNTRALDFAGGGAHDYRGFFDFVGARAELDQPGSPILMNIRTTAPVSPAMKPLNITTYSCGDSSLGCSCGDCPSSRVCSDTAAAQLRRKGSCELKIGSITAKCVDMTVTIAYVVLLTLFLGLSVSRRYKTRTERIRQPTRPNTNQSVGSDDSLVLWQKDESFAMQGNGRMPEESHSKGGDGHAHLPIVQGYISNFYRRYGTLIATHPALILSISIGFVLVLCIGLLRFKVETRPDKLWVGRGSQALEQKQFFDSHLAPFYRIEQLVLGTIPDSRTAKRPSIVTDRNIKLLFDLQKKVDALRANYSGSVVSLKDICLKPLGKDCATQSVLQYAQMNPKSYKDNGGIDHVTYCFQHFTSAGNCRTAFKAPLDPSVVLGGFSGRNYSEATAFVVTYPVKNFANKIGNETGKAVAWERAFIELVKEELMPMLHSKNLTLSFSSESSIVDELKRESTADVPTIVISYLVMFTYISLTLGDTHRLSTIYISSKVLLALSGVVLVFLSVLGSVGFFSAIGVKSTLIIIEVIPFLVLAVGVDNMCIIVHAVKRQPMELPLEMRISNALAEVGPSITLASFSEVLAFAVGSFISMPACRVFSMFAALAVLLDFMLQVTAFVALVIMDFRRAEDRRIDCFPCLKVSSLHSISDSDIGSPRPGFLARYMKEIHAPILGHWLVKMLVISIFFALALISIALCTRIEPGLEQQIVLPKDSYLQGYFKNISEYLRVGPPLYFIVKGYNYSAESKQTNQLCSISQCDSNSLLNEIAKASLTPKATYIAKPAASWLDDFLVWLSPEAFGCCRKFTNGTYCPPDDQPPCCAADAGFCGLSATCQDCSTCFRHSDLTSNRPSTKQFMQKLPWFLQALPSADCAKGGQGAYTDTVNLQGYENGIIQASSFRTYHTPLNKQVDYVNSMKAALDFSSRMSRALKMDIFPYSVFYLYFEQYLHIWRSALINLAIAVGAVFLVCWIITSSLWSSLIILMVLVMIVVDLLGVMAIRNIQLNAVSVVNLVMSVGIAVEFCVHITHAFSVSSGNKDQRVRHALETMGASVFSGITLTKLVGVIVLAFSKTEVFVVYYFQMYLALVVLGFLHGLVFLPVFLSLFGPAPRTVEVAQKHDNKTQDPTICQ